MAKGSNFIGLASIVEKRFGRPILEQVISGLPTDCASLLQSGRLSMGGWYPLEWYRAMHRGVQAATSNGPQLAWTLSHAFVREQLGGIYRPLLAAISPNWLFAFPSMIFSRYFSRGKLTVPENRQGSVRGEWSGCSGFDLNVWNANWGGSQTALELAGAKNVAITVLAGGKDGDDFATAEARWT